MKKVYGIFRGFPGLGRVSSGIALLKDFKKRGYEVAAISYYQGIEALRKQEVPILLEYNLEPCDITSIGINPITGFASKIIEKILEDEPEVVLMDGEPLLQSTLCDVYPRERVVALLNPSDLHNDSLPKSTVCFYHKNYLSGANAIVHGVGIKNEIVVERNCKIHYVPTLLRQEIFEIAKVDHESQRIVGILGGGTVNSSEKFLSSTIAMGQKMVAIAKELKEYRFDIYCNDVRIKNEIEKSAVVPANVTIISDYTSPLEMYQNACLVIARAGRNVVSELLYLNMPGLLIATNGDYRSKEQEKNIDKMVEASNYLFDKISILEEEQKLMEKIKNKLHGTPAGNGFVPGNEYAIKVLHEIIEEN